MAVTTVTRKRMFLFDPQSVQLRYDTACKMRERGATYGAIARALGYSDGGDAFVLLHRSQPARQAAAQAQQAIASQQEVAYGAQRHRHMSLAIPSYRGMASRTWTHSSAWHQGLGRAALRGTRLRD